MPGEQTGMQPSVKSTWNRFGSEYGYAIYASTTDIDTSVSVGEGKWEIQLQSARIKSGGKSPAEPETRWAMQGHAHGSFRQIVTRRVVCIRARFHAFLISGGRWRRWQAGCCDYQGA